MAQASRKLKRHERATLNHAYAGEIGRGAFAAICMEFALTVAIYEFLIDDKWLLGCLSSSPSIGLIAAIFATSFSAGHRKKNIVFSLESLSRVFIILAAFSETGPIFILTMSLAIALNAVGVPLVSGIYGANFKTVVRGQAVGKLQTVALATTASVAFLAGQALKIDHSYYRWVLLSMGLLCLFCSWCGSRMPEPHQRGTINHRAMLSDFVKVLMRDKTFAYLELVWFIIGFANLWLFPIRVIWLKEINFSVQEVIIATTTTLALTQVLTVWMWGRVLYRFNFAIYRIILGLLFIAGIGIFFFSTTLPFVCLGSVFWGLGLSGGALSWRLVGTFFATPGRVPLYMSVHAFLCGVRGLIGPILALHLSQTYSPQVVAMTSIGLFLLTTVMLIPLIPVMQKQQIKHTQY